MVGPEGSQPLTTDSGLSVVLCGISAPFGTLSPAKGQITYVLRTRPPLYSPRRTFAFDLHVLSAPLTFALSQDQTLQLMKTCELVLLMTAPDKDIRRATCRGQL